MKKRILEDKILQALEKVQILIITGSHRVGKSSIIDKIHKILPSDKVYVPNKYGQNSLDFIKSKSSMRQIKEKYDFMIIDNFDLKESEINQLVKNFGKKIIITSSSQVNLKKINFNNLNVFTILPLSIKEIYPSFDLAKKNIDKILTFGSYPEVLELKTKKDRIFKLSEILEANLKNNLAKEMKVEFNKLIQILKFLALNIGQNISTPTLMKKLDMEKTEIKNYIDFLEKRFIIFTIKSFSRQLPKEMSKAKKYYFWDIGIRNLLINNFNPINTREDIDQVWENFCISERLKRNYFFDFKTKNYFWKTYDKKEIPYVEETHGFLFAYSFSWKKSTAHYPRQFLNAYPNSVFTNISFDKFWDFIS